MRWLKQFLCGLTGHGWVPDDRQVGFLPVWERLGWHCIHCGKRDG